MSLLSARHIMALSIGIVFFALSYTSISAWAEYRLLDFAHRFLPEYSPKGRVVLAAIDDESLVRVGPWPWGRDRIGSTLDQLRRLGARGAVLVLPLTQPETPAALAALEGQAEKAKRSTASVLREWVKRLDTDAELGRALARSGRTVLGVPTDPRSSSGELPENGGLAVEVESFFLRVFSPLLVAPGNFEVSVRGPVPELAERAFAMGVVDSAKDPAGGVRLAHRVDEGWYPGLSLAVRTLAGGTASMVVGAVPRVRIDDTIVRAGPDLRIYPPPMDLPELSVAGLWERGAAAKVKGAYVILGVTTPELPQLGDAEDTRGHARTLAALLDNQHIAKPSWFYLAQRLGLVLGVAYLFLFPARFAARSGLVIGAFVALIAANAGFFILVAQSLWVPVMFPAILVVVGHLGFVLLDWSAREFAGSHTELQRVRLAYAGALKDQGKAPEALAELRKLTVEPPVADVLYELGREFERKRRYDLAGEAYRAIKSAIAGYADVDKRLAQITAHTEVMSLPLVGGGVKQTVIMDSAIERPKLAHYQLDRELGRGAMGVVYLATDTKLGRQVALKALSLAHEFDEEALAEARDRFRREAEAAARLNHPNIVTIFEAGEDADLAYLAMDYIPGDTLDAYTHPHHLLSVDAVLDIGAKVACALDYAHEQQVVHRDVKPSNIMYVEEGQVVKVADFGIARVTDDSFRTRTGIVLGTPSYMSPEQATGKRVDGRSDLFSLGVTLYQLLTGRLPFSGESLANLVYMITAKKHEGVRKVRPELHNGISRMINRALEKNPRRRFADGAAMAEAIEACRRD